jgi:hypothetical protein
LLLAAFEQLDGFVAVGVVFGDFSVFGFEADGETAVGGLCGKLVAVLDVLVWALTVNHELRFSESPT